MKNLVFRHIAPLFMATLILLSGIPFFAPEDANHDRKIDIKDAVISLQMADHIRSFDTARGPGKNIAACEHALKTVAGLKGIMPPAFETEKNFSSHFCFLISCVDIHSVFLNFDTVIDCSASFSSIVSSPPYQPPILS